MYVSATWTRFSRGRSTPAIRAIRPSYPCFCLCLGLSQITITRLPRLTTLHFSHIRLTDARTFNGPTASCVYRNRYVIRPRVGS